jgi:hypothetical protein
MMKSEDSNSTLLVIPQPTFSVSLSSNKPPHNLSVGRMFSNRHIRPPGIKRI